MVVRYNNYKLDNPDDRVDFVKDYGKWLFGVGKSATKVVGAAVKEPWMPQKPNITNETDVNDTLEDLQTEKVYVVYD